MFSLFLLKNIDCGYSLEPPRRDGANEYHSLYFYQKYEKYQNFLCENFHFLQVKFSVYLNRHDFVMYKHLMYRDSFPGIYNGFLVFLFIYLFYFLFFYFYLFIFFFFFFCCCCFFVCLFVCCFIFFYFILVNLLYVIERRSKFVGQPLFRGRCHVVQSF